MRVMKFGGTSLSSRKLLATVVGLVREASATERVVVVTSALASVTDLLTELVASAGRPDPEVLRELAGRYTGLWDSARDGADFEERVEAIFHELRVLGEEAHRRGGWAPQMKDQALGLGERAASLLLASHLQARGVPARPVDGSDVIRTDSRFGSARVLEAGTRHLARWTLGRIPPEVVPVVGGFSGSDDKGRATTLGRGSSDLSATHIAAALSARTVEIWTDVDGVYHGDPKLNPDAVPLPRLSYGQARALARNGAKVLHPNTMDPIEPLGIPLTVRNTLRPESPGSWVGEDPGSQATDDPGVRATDHPGNRVARATGARGPFGSGRRVHLILAGATGGVGSTLLRQLETIAPSLLREEGVEVRISGAFSSRAQLWDRDGVLPGETLDALSPSLPPDWQELTQRLMFDPPENPIFVDCTASPEVSDQYLCILEAGVPIITPNKLAGSGPLSQYHSIRRAASEGDLPFRYETTVGAALPILRTVRDLRDAGDGFRRIEGVLSGTLSFVFSRLAEGVPFSRAVREARDRGFTEPHPREDLRGTDVARKLLILLREAGFDFEPEAIPVESLVPDALAGVEDPEEFLEGLGSVDAFWARRIGEQRGESLAYVAWFDGKEAGVGVKALPPHHPLSAVRPTENRVILTTDRYPDVPLTIAGPGAGREVTASGVLADLLEAIRRRYGARRVA